MIICIARNIPLGKTSPFLSGRIFLQSNRFNLITSFLKIGMKQCIILALAVLVLGCTDRDDDVDAVNIRIKNASTLPFDEVQVADAEEVYENIPSGDYSGYFEYGTAYRYAFIQIRSGEETFTLQPIDFVGETPLPIGFYTYELDITEEGNVNLNFRIDY